MTVLEVAAAAAAAAAATRLHHHYYCYYYLRMLNHRCHYYRHLAASFGSWLQALETLKGENTTLVISPDSEFFEYLKSDGVITPE